MWGSLKEDDIKIIQQIAEEKRNGKTGLLERLCIQLEHLPETITVKGKKHTYPLFELYQQL